MTPMNDPARPSQGVAPEEADAGPDEPSAPWRAGSGWRRQSLDTLREEDLVDLDGGRRRRLGPLLAVLVLVLIAAVAFAVVTGSGPVREMVAKLMPGEKSPAPPREEPPPSTGTAPPGAEPPQAVERGASVPSGPAAATPSPSEPPTPKAEPSPARKATPPPRGGESVAKAPSASPPAETPRLPSRAGTSTERASEDPPPPAKAPAQTSEERMADYLIAQLGKTGAEERARGNAAWYGADRAEHRYWKNVEEAVARRPES
jgi:hypothetical protein